MSFDWRAAEWPAGSSPLKDELLHVEFRSPAHVTYLIRAYAAANNVLKIRFSPTQSGEWSYRISSSLKRLDSQEAAFQVTDSGLPGFVDVANLRHWRTTNKLPHLWLGATVPLFALDQITLESWLTARKQDGFTHIGTTLLTNISANKPLDSEMLPNEKYFASLDDRILAAISRGFTLDLVIADQSFLRTGAFANFDERDLLMRYVIARYGGLNVTWQGIERYENVADGRTLVKQIGECLQKYDSFQHPRSTDARTSSSPLTQDGWMNYILESVENPQFGAVEHQFTEQPQIHLVSANEPDAFRHQLWSCTTNGEYPSVSYEALGNATNIQAIRTWVKVVSDTRHWEFEPYFDVDGARAVGLAEIGYIAYAQNPGIVEINFDRHKYTPIWINPVTGEETVEKNWRGEVFSRSTPDNARDWILDIEREGHKESMLKSVRFESIDPPVQEAETDPAKTPFDVTSPVAEQINTQAPTAIGIKVTRANRASRTMQYVWWGEMVASGLGTRLLAVGSSGNLNFPPEFLKNPGATLTLRVQAINANGKAYELTKIYTLNP